MLELRPHDASFHAAGTVGARGGCGWHGTESCAEPARWSFVWQSEPSTGGTARESACDRGLEEAVAGGYLVGQTLPRRPVRGT